MTVVQSISTENKGALIKGFLVLSTFEGVLALLWMFRDPSMERNALLLGYSASRLMLGLVVLIPVLMFAGLTVRAFKDPRWLKARTGWLEQRLSTPERLLVLALGLAFGGMVVLFIILVWQRPFFHQYERYVEVFEYSLYSYEAFQVIFERVLSVLGWIAALQIQAAFFLAAAYPEHFSRREFYDWKVIWKTLLALAAGTLAVFHWVVLAFRLQVFTLIPGWYWDITNKPFSLRDVYFLLVVAVSLVAAFYILRDPQRWGRRLVLLVALGYFVQLSFGILGGGGFESLRFKYVDSYHRSYAVIVTEQRMDPLDTVRNYEQKYADKMFPSTKPPGLLTIYNIIERLVDWVNPQPTAELRFLVLTRFLAYFLPLMTFLTLPALFAFAYRLKPADQALLPPLVYIFLPSIILIPLFMDQALYPLLFMIGALAALWAVKRGAFLPAMLVGFYLYLAVFVTFSLLALPAMVLALFAADFIVNRRERGFSPTMKLFAGLLLGILAAYVIFYFAFNYDFVTRYQGAMGVHVDFDFVRRTDVGPKSVEQIGLKDYLGAMWLNNVEFAASVGFPVFLLFLSRSLRIVVSFLRRRLTWADGALGAFLAAYIALNLFGQTQGEVSRLWMFWTPMVVLFAGFELAALYKRRRLVVGALIFVQLITILLTFKFQDFLV
jgi:hypothetical protein